MSDGMSLEFRQTPSMIVENYPDEGGAPVKSKPLIDLTTFSQWIELQSIETIVGVLDLIGNDLYRRHWPTYAEECKALAKNMRSTLTYLKHQGTDEVIDGA